MTLDQLKKANEIHMKIMELKNESPYFLRHVPLTSIEISEADEIDIMAKGKRFTVRDGDYCFGQIKTDLFKRLLQFELDKASQIAELEKQLAEL